MLSRIIIGILGAIVALEAVCEEPASHDKPPSEFELAYFGAESCDAQSVRVSGFETRSVRYLLEVLPDGDLAVFLEGEKDESVSEVLRFSGDFTSEIVRPTESSSDVHEFARARLSTWDWGHRSLIELRSIDAPQEHFLFIPEDTACLERFLDYENINPRETLFVKAVIHHRHDGSIAPELSVAEASRLLAERPAIVNTPEFSPSGTREPFVCIAGGPGALSCTFDAGSVGPINSMNCTVQCVPPSYACCGFGFLSNCACIGGNSGGGIPPSLPPDPGGSGPGGSGGGSGGGGGGGGSGGGGGGGVSPPGDDDDDDDDDPGDDDANGAAGDPNG